LWLGNERGELVGAQLLDRDKWGLIDRPLYPTAHDWDGVSIPDLVEDKQRIRSVGLNLGIKAMESDVYPMYAYDELKQANKDYWKFGLNKFVPVNGDPNSAVAPIRKAAPNMQLLDFIFQTLDLSAQKATATPEIQQGSMSAQNRTLGELNMVKAQSDNRYSLTAKIFGQSERRFWQQHYLMYKIHFEDKIDKKVLRLQGALGPRFRELTKENFVSEVDPDVRIVSKSISKLEKYEMRNSLLQYFGVVFQDPTANRRWAEKELGRLEELTKEQIDSLFPPTIDEMLAEDENILLNKDKNVRVVKEDDHAGHIWSMRRQRTRKQLSDILKLIKQL
jgi:hypothetical protein